LITDTAPTSLDNQDRDFKNWKKAQDLLLASETRYRRLFETAQDGILILDAGTGQIVEVNPFFIAFLGFSREEYLGKKIWDLGIFKDVVANKDNFEELQQKESIRYENLPLETADGRNIAVEFVSNVYMVNSQKVIQCNIRDITERKKMTEQIEASLAEKEVLLKEIHHRVKNNMQVISSLLFMQERLVKDDKTREILRESQNRIKSMALIHEKLYQSVDLVRIDYTEYLQGISRYMLESYHMDPTFIKLQISSETVFLNIDKAVPCSLILNELISNSLKHAFPKERKGIITIDLQIKAGTYILIYCDDGIGIPDGITVDGTESLGMHLINGLVKQLNGSIILDRKTGMKYTITFPE